MAYVDPVSGFIILQLIIAGVAGTIAFFRRSLLRIIGKVTGRSPVGEVKTDSK